MRFAKLKLLIAKLRLIEHRSAPTEILIKIVEDGITKAFSVCRRNNKKEHKALCRLRIVASDKFLCKQLCSAAVSLLELRKFINYTKDFEAPVSVVPMPWKYFIIDGAG